MSARHALYGATLVVAAALWALIASSLWSSSEVPSSLRLPHIDTARLFPAAVLHRADSYDRVASLVDLVSLLLTLLVFLAYARWGHGFVRESAAGPLGTGMLLGMLGFGLLWLAEVPLTAFELWWDRRHGLSHESYVHALFGGWIALGFEFVLLCAALAVVMGLARLVGDWWWLLAVPVFVGLLTLDAFVGPYLVHTRPVTDPALEATIANLEKRSDAGHVPVRIQDVSTQTSLPNAETEGLGPSRRVVVWNTLLDGRFSPAEVRVVIAHELGHAKRNHIWKSIAWFALFALPGAFIVSRVTRRRGGMGEPAAVPLALLTLVVLQLIALPVRNAITRRMEAEADWLALRTTRDPRAASALFEQFVPTALSNPNPPSWEYLLAYDHPTVDQRIAMARAWAARYATSASAAQLP